MTKPDLQVSRVRPMAQADLELVFTWRNHLDVRRNMYTKHEISFEEHRDWFERTQYDPRKHLLIYEANHMPLGFVSFTELKSSRVAEWGYYAAPDAPKGTGRALGRAALDYAFYEITLHKVCGQALAFNERSIRLHQSFGFEQEGVLRDQHFDGEHYHHVICFGLLRNKWWSKP
jgi:UDP-4-amino-4,6-dideoxy-N-acetyl-beta-L-altrosamine N-acetyltransferase